MWEKYKKKKEIKKKEYPIKDISFDEVQKAIQLFSRELPKHIPLSVIVNDDLTLDYHLLAPILKGIPKETYYMSKETYDLFEEKDYELAKNLDEVQRAVDKYMDITDELPIISGDPYRKISFHKLHQLNLLKDRPNRDFYITDQEFLVTSEKPR